MSTKVLIIEDDESVAQAVAVALEFEGYISKVITRGEIAVKTALSFKPDLILLDFLLSGTDGKLICQALRKNKATKDIPIIMMSAHPTASKIAKEVGVERFLAKPFDIQTLATAIFSLVGA